MLGATGAFSVKYFFETKPTLFSYLILYQSPCADTNSTFLLAPAAKKYYYTTANLNLRASNSLSGKVIVTLLPNKKVEFVSAHGDWYKIKYENKVGFV
ncbi:SH3 domain-containing protein [Acinetobacter soli]